jgi:putative cardiolipin synthase
MTSLAARASAFRDSDYARVLRSTDLGLLVRSGLVALTTASVSVLYDRPDKLEASPTEEEGHIVSRLRKAIESVQRELVLVSPYFVPSERGIRILCGLARRGVHVRVLTNSLASTDVAAVHAGYARYRPRLLACGVALHELKPAVMGSGKVRRVLSSGVSLHAKAVMLDGKTVLLGSMNLDPRSRMSNTEIAALIDSDVLGRQLGSWFDEATSPDRAFRPELTQPGDPSSPLVWNGSEDDETVRYTSEPLASWWQRLTSGLLGLLVPEDLL